MFLFTVVILSFRQRRDAIYLRLNLRLRMPLHDCHTRKFAKIYRHTTCTMRFVLDESYV